eukprot:scaffold2956_cov390-Prasinococcus_capsulatus_cf.AAC.4
MVLGASATISVVVDAVTRRFLAPRRRGDLARAAYGAGDSRERALWNDPRRVQVGLRTDSAGAGRGATRPAAAARMRAVGEPTRADGAEVHNRAQPRSIYLPRGSGRATLLVRIVPMNDKAIAWGRPPRLTNTVIFRPAAGARQVPYDSNNKAAHNACWGWCTVAGRVVMSGQGRASPRSSTRRNSPREWGASRVLVVRSSHVIAARREIPELVADG